MAIFKNMFKTLSRQDKILISILIAVVFAGAWLRFFHLDFGLPQLYQPDEEFFVAPALRVAAGHLDPGWYGAPAQPLIYAVAGAFRLVNFFVNLSKDIHVPVQQNYPAFVHIFQTAGRVIPALGGTVMSILSYFLGALWSRRAGVIAAALCAFSFYLVDHSHIIRPDILQTLFVLGVVLCALKILHAPSQKRWYIGLGVCLGLAVTMKYPSLFLIVPLAFLVVLLWRKKIFYFRLWILAVAIGLIVVFVSAPYLFIHFHEALKDVGIENRGNHGGHDGFSFFGNLWWYLSAVLDWQLGTVIYLFTILFSSFLGYKIIRRRLEPRERDVAVLLLFALTYLIAISFLSLHWERWTIPVVSLLFIIAASAIDFAMSKLRHPLTMVLILIMVFAGPSLRLARTLYGYAHPYTSEIARQWILKNISAGAHIETEPIAAPLDAHRYTIDKVPNGSWYTFEEYRQKGATHLVISEGVYGDILKESLYTHPEENYMKAMRRYGELFSKLLLVFEIRSHPIFSAQELIMSNDAKIFRTLDLRVLKGPFIRVYAFP